MPTRDEMWTTMGEDVDVLVIGGGITGAGIARDAARRGLKTLLVEMRDLAFGTSSRSSKLVHGGLRYLEQFEFSLVFEAVSERRILLDIAPHLVNPLGFVFPVYTKSRTSLLKINAGMWLYDGLSLFRSPKRWRQLRPKDIATEEPALNREGFKGAPLYYDCSTDDARLTLENALDAAEAGATIATWAKVVGFEHDDAGRAVAAHIECALTGERKTIRAASIVNATGPWTDETLSMSRATKREMLRPTKGTHIVVDHEKLPVNHAVVCFHPDDGRVLFAIPWGPQTYLGTTDTDYDGDPADVYASAEDVKYIIDAAAEYFPDHPLCADDVLSTWSGLRPLISPSTGGDDDEIDESSVSREHQIIVGSDGLVTIAGGKLTTYRLMAKQVVDTVARLLRLSGQLPESLERAATSRSPLPGAVGWPEDDDHRAVANAILAAGDALFDTDTAELLANTYGMKGIEVAKRVVDEPALAARICPTRPEILAQIDYAIDAELCCTVSDLLKQRTQLYYREPDQALGAVEAVADRMAARLGWSDERRSAEIAAYRDEVEASRRWRASWPPAEASSGA